MEESVQVWKILHKYERTYIDVGKPVQVWKNSYRCARTPYRYGGTRTGMEKLIKV